MTVSITNITTAVGISSVPLILAALGGLISERAGVLNISLEGCIGAGAFTAAVLSATGAPPLIAVLSALTVGIIFGALLAGTHLGLGSNLFIAGMGVNLLVPSLSSLVSQSLYGHKGNIRIPISFSEGYAWIMIPLTLSVSILLHKSAFGRRLRAVGDSPDFISERGFLPSRIKWTALLISSALAALGGAFLTFRIGAYVPGISSGRGWIALVLIWLGFRNPIGILGMSYFFSLIEIISGRIQSWTAFPTSMSLILPYVMALLALIFVSIAKKLQTKRGSFKKRLAKLLYNSAVCGFGL